MRQVENRWLSWLLVVMLITKGEQATSQPTDRNSTLIRYYCSMYRGWSETYFVSNLNTTLSRLRQQLSTSGYAVARTLINGESVWGFAWCRGYLSIPDCLSCFDYAVNQLKVCGLGNAARAIYSDCDVRYENGNFYEEATYRGGVVICGNIDSPQPIKFSKAVERLLLDLQIVAPRAKKFYAASVSKVAADNDTVYAIAQCTLNVSHSVCLECLMLRSKSLYDCLPTTSGRATDNSCFMRYDTTPFFGQNQTTDITSLLWDEDSIKMRYIIMVGGGGVSFLFLALMFFVWYRRWKKRGRCQQGKHLISSHKMLSLFELLSSSISQIYPMRYYINFMLLWHLTCVFWTIVSVNGIVSYNYKHLQLATNNFSQENIIGKGGFGEVFKVIKSS